jgi:hypothetical protein
LGRTHPAAISTSTMTAKRASTQDLYCNHRTRQGEAGVGAPLELCWIMAFPVVPFWRPHVCRATR